MDILEQGTFFQALRIICINSKGLTLACRNLTVSIEKAGKHSNYKQVAQGQRSLT